MEVSASALMICARPGCGQSYQAKRSTKKFCSSRCRALASNHTRANQRNAVTSGNAKQRKSLTSGNETLTRTPTLAELLRHLDKFYGPYQLENDLDCLLSCAREADHDTIVEAAKAKAARLGMRGIRAKLKLPPARKGLTKRECHYYVERAVSAGKQGRADLDALV